MRTPSICAALLLCTCQEPSASHPGLGHRQPSLIAATPSSLVAGQHVPDRDIQVHGDSFSPMARVAVWFDANGDSVLQPTEGFLLQESPVTANASGSFDVTLAFAADVAAGAYFIRAAECPPVDCSGVHAAVSAPVTVEMGISHSKFASGSTITISGAGYPASSPINVWYDLTESSTLSGTAPATVMSDASGNFSTNLVINGGGTVDALFAAISGTGGVQVAGTIWVHAGVGSTPRNNLKAEIGSCWFNECLLYDSSGIASDTLCLLGNSPTDSLGYLADCKALDVNYSAAPGGYDFSNQGPVFLGAGVLAAMLNDILPPPSGCVALTSAIAIAEGYGNPVPDKVSLLAITCGTPFTPPLDLGLYTLFLSNVPDLPFAFGAIAAINTAAFAAGFAVAAASVGALAAGPLLAAVAGAATTAAAGVSGVDPATASVLGATVGGSALGTIAAAGILGGAAAPFVTLTIQGGAQLALAEATVAGAIACGYVNYYCYGADITANLLAHPELQSAQVPVPLLQPPFMGPPEHDPCTLVPGRTCWGSIIGWSTPVCVNPMVDCESNPATLAMPGSAGVNNIDPTGADLRCMTGTVQGLSIGYDGDISFSIDSEDVRQFTNYHNYLPGPGGTDPPNGIDVEIPLRNPLGDPGVITSPAFLPVLTQLRPGMEVRACGHWVADMHMLWNELHPVTSIAIAPNFTLEAAPASVTVQAGETASFDVTATLISGPSSTISLSVSSGPPGTFTAPTISVADGSPGTSTLTVSGAGIGDHTITIRAVTPDGVVRTASVALHVYDYAIAVAPANATVLRGGSTAYVATATLVPGSTEVDIPSISLGTMGLPGDATITSPSFTLTPTMTGVSTTVHVASAAAGSLGDFAFTVNGTSPLGTVTASDPASALHLYDFTVGATPATLEILTTGANAWQVAVAHVAGSSSSGVPVLHLSGSGLPPNVSGVLTPSSGSLPAFTSTYALVAANAAPTSGVPVTIRGTDARSPEGGSRSIGVTLEVLTPAQALGELIDKVHSLPLNGGQQNSLIVKLQHAIGDLTSPPPGAHTACNQLQAFVNEVNADVASGNLTAAQGASLLGGPLGIFAIMAAIPCS